MGNLRPYLAFVSKFWAGEDGITRSRTASSHVDGGGDLLWPEVECVEEELAMPLTTTGEPGYYEPSTDNIGFWMLNGTRERQRCAVTLEALEKLKTGLLRGIAEQIGCFNTNRRIERVASEKFDKRYFEADGTTVLVKAEDL